MKSSIIGFDARRVYQGVGSGGQYRPIAASVDPHHWPSIFESEVTAYLKPVFVGPNQSLWEDLPILVRAATLAVQQLGSPVQVIAISEIQRSSHPLERHPAAAQQAEELGTVPWLGYDVADYFLRSGIDIVAKYPDATPAPGQFEETAYGLLRKANDAWRVRSKCNRLAPEHRPFYVYSVFLVETLEFDLS